MFVKTSWRTYKGKRYTYYAIATSYRPKKGGGNPRHKILANISHLPQEIIKKIAILLKAPKARLIEDLNSFFKKSFIYGPIVFFYLFIKKLGMLEAMKCLPKVTKILMIAVILNRILDPRSKLGSVDWIKETSFPFLFGIAKKNSIVNQIYKSMDVFYKNMNKIMESFFKENKRGTKFLLYDVTSVFFEGEGPKDLAKFGYSRDKRKDRPQILLGLCLNEEKMPIYFDIFAGNVQDKKTVIPLIEKIKEKFDIEECIFVGDRGMVSIENLEKIREVGLEYIVALTHTEARELLWKKKIGQKELFDVEIPITILVEEKEKDKYVLCGSEFRNEHDKKTLNKLLEKGKKALEEVKKMVEEGRIKDKTKIIKRAQKKLTKSGAENFYDFSIDDDKFKIIPNTQYIQMAENLCGYYILKTTKIDMPDDEVERNYKQLKFVEKAFRELKELVEIRPIFHWKERRVKTHIFLCILAQVLVSRCLEVLKKSGWLDEFKNHSFRYFLDILSEIRLGIFKIEGIREKIINELEDSQKEILRVFEMDLEYFKNPFREFVV